MSDLAEANRRAHDLYGLRIETQFVAEVKNDEWPHFEWRVTLTRVNVINGVDHPVVTRVLPYRMGLAHVQTPCGKRITSNARFGEWPCQHVRCQGKRVPTPPDLYSVLCSLKSDATHGETFDEWCRDYGYETDSRSALDLYFRCQQSEAESRVFFGDAVWNRLLDDETFA